MLLKKLNAEKHAEKIENLKAKKQTALETAQNDIDKTKKEKINQIKEKFREKKQSTIDEKDRALQ